MDAMEAAGIDLSIINAFETLMKQATIDAGEGPIATTMGVMQGESSSPFLWSVFLNDLLI